MNKLEEAAREELIHSYSNPYVGNTVYGNEAMLNMFRKGAQWQAEQSPWISAEERKPKDGEQVWVKSNRFNNLPLFYIAGRFRTSLKGGYCDDSITHWMPIPE